MRKLIYLLLPLSFLVGCASGDVPPGPEPDPDPPGPTPVYIETPSKIVTSYDNGSVREYYFQYNESGYKTRIETKHFNESKDLDGHFIETLTYDEHNEPIKDIRYDEFTKTNETDLTYTYEYDNSGNILTQTQQGIQGYTLETNNKDIFTYDNLNRIMSHEEYLSSSVDVDPTEWEYRHIYEYSEGKSYRDFKKKVTYKATIFSPYETISQDFDNQGRVIHSLSTKPDKLGEEEETTYTYDDYDCLVHELTVSEVTGTSEITTTYYKHNPLKPLHVEREALLQYLGSYTIDYEYDEFDRTKKITQTPQFSSTPKYIEEYYYD